MPKISVIIPVYNAGNFLRKCLDSVIAQSFDAVEVICINDGSVDDSGEILAEYADRDPRIKIITKKNAGASAARNDGLAAARGEYIHFLDADDFIDPNYYDRMYAAATRNDSDMAASGFVSDSKYTTGIKYKKNLIVTGLRAKFQKTNALVDSYIWRYLFRREFITRNKFKFRTDLISQEDTIFLLDALKQANSVAIVSGTNYHYVILNPDSALNSRDPVKRKKIKEQYVLGKKFRRQFARDNKLMSLWRMRKLQKLPIIGKLIKG